MWHFSFLNKNLAEGKIIKKKKKLNSTKLNSNESSASTEHEFRDRSFRIWRCSRIFEGQTERKLLVHDNAIGDLWRESAWRHYRRSNGTADFSGLVQRNRASRRRLFRRRQPRRNRPNFATNRHYSAWWVPLPFSPSRPLSPSEMDGCIVERSIYRQLKTRSMRVIHSLILSVKCNTFVKSPLRQKRF